MLPESKSQCWFGISTSRPRHSSLQFTPQIRQLILDDSLLSGLNRAIGIGLGLRNRSGGFVIRHSFSAQIHSDFYQRSIVFKWGICRYSVTWGLRIFRAEISGETWQSLGMFLAFVALSQTVMLDTFEISVFQVYVIVVLQMARLMLDSGIFELNNIINFVESAS